MGYGVRSMRRFFIVVSVMIFEFCVLWILLFRIGEMIRYEEPILSVIPMEEEQKVIAYEFPFYVPGTTLIAEQIVSYEGLFNEGEEAYHVTDTAALLLHNYGDSGISEAEIVLCAGQLQFTFYAQTLPAGERVLVQEQTGQEFGPKAFDTCCGWQNTDSADWIHADCVKLEYPDMGEVGVSNQTDRVLNGVYLFYKNYLPEAGFYVVGKSRIYYIERIEPGEYIRIYPTFYAYEYSRFAQIRIDNG